MITTTRNITSDLEEDVLDMMSHDVLWNNKVLLLTVIHYTFCTSSLTGVELTLPA